MKKQIVTDLKFLREKCLPIETLAEAEPIIQDLEDSLDISKGCGLSANQIGYKKQVSIVKVEGKRIVLLNPAIIYREYPIRIDGEGCLSMPGLHISTRRYNLITVENYDYQTGNLEAQIYKGLTAIAVEHETDHLFGILMTDRKWKAR